MNEGDQAMRLVRLEEQVRGLREYAETRLKAIEEARTIAYHDMERRLEGMNEFRAQLQHQEATYLTRDIYGQAHEALRQEMIALVSTNQQRIEAAAERIEAEIATMRDRTDEDIRVLRESRAMLEGKASQTEANIALLFASLAAVMSIVALLLRVTGHG